MEWELPSSFFKLIFQCIQYFFLALVGSILLLSKVGGIYTLTEGTNHLTFIITIMMFALLWIINMVEWDTI